jgi:hypothetical protein
MKNIILNINIINILLLLATPIWSQNSENIIGELIPMRNVPYSPKIIVHEGKLWSYHQEGAKITEIKASLINAKDTLAFQYDGILLGTGVHSFYKTTTSWDIDNNNIYGLQGLRIGFCAAYCYGAGGAVVKIPQKELRIWEKGVKRDANFNYPQASERAFFGNLPISQWFEKKYYDKFIYNWKHNIFDRPFKEIADSVIRNTYFDFFKLKSDDSTSFFALCEGNVLSTWHFTRFKQHKLREYVFKPTDYFDILEHHGQPYLVSAEGTVFKLGRQMKQIRQLPRPLKEGWLIVDKDHDKIYFLEQKYFSFADKPRAIGEIVKNAFVIF